MARLILFAPCQIALADSTFGGLSLINVLESLGVPKFPSALPPMAIVTMWRRHEDEVDSAMMQRVDITSPDDTVIASFETNFYFDKMGHRIMNHIGNAPLTQGGKYEFSVYIARQGGTYPDQPAAKFPVLIMAMPTGQIGPTGAV